jgi:hypothetical protein
VFVYIFYKKNIFLCNIKVRVVVSVLYLSSKVS